MNPYCYPNELLPYQWFRCLPIDMNGKSCCRLSARNQLKGKIVEIEEGAVNARIVLDIGCGHRVTSIITMASLRDLNLTVGGTATAVIKSSDVIMMV